ncbi:g127 [Coccomyxa viridis]|uniref:G127 protein n=1 Tax=Coccomyxa viridis TaxID=1274662 RepID=A0ABP1FF72_9CHLO
MQGCGLTCYGGEEERWAALQGLPPPTSAYRPGVSNVAPRANAWQPSRSNTQTPPVKGKGREVQPDALQPRQHGTGRPEGKYLP